MAGRHGKGRGWDHRGGRQQRGGGRGGKRRGEDRPWVAVPEQVARRLAPHRKILPPGHAFRLYYDGWQDPRPKGLSAMDTRTGVGKLGSVVSARAQGVAVRLAKRQERLARALSGAGHRVLIAPMRSTSRLATGLGMEHPTENGFAFFDPHGVAYLPGSSVKGTLRRAAEELCFFSEKSERPSVAEILLIFGLDDRAAYFGHKGKDDDKSAKERVEAWQARYKERISETDIELLRPWLDSILRDLPRDEQAGWKKNPRKFLADLASGKQPLTALHLRGCVDFWDVFPVGDGADPKLVADMMTPHFADYYGKGKAPADSQEPNPIAFLCLPENLTYSFIFVFRPRPTVPLAWDRVQQVLTMALEYAGTQLGFGAKTSVGYGQMVPA